MMSNARLRALALGARFWKATNGAAAVTFALFMTVIIGMCGFVIDIGHVAYVQRELQASVDAAALAGAHDINCCATSKALTTAATFSGLAGEDNEISGVTVSMVAGYPQLKCFASTGVSCSGIDNANGIVVEERADVPMWFAGIFGITTMPVTATSTAGLRGGPAKPLDIEIVLDTTHSMNDADPSCSIAGASRLQCAEAGVGTLLGDLSYSSDQVGLMVFPGPTTATVANDYNCSGSNPSITPYASSTNYQVLGLGSDFKSSSSGSSLNSASDIVHATGGGGGGCPGMQAPGGEGTYYAGAINAAQNALTTSGRDGRAKGHHPAQRRRRQFAERLSDRPQHRLRSVPAGGERRAERGQRGHLGVYGGVRRFDVQLG